jgi:cytochrome P450
MYLLLPKLMPKDFKKRYAQHATLTREKTKKRIELGAAEGRDDFFTDYLRKGTPAFNEMEQQSIEFIIAGSETTSTALTAQTYFLLRNPESLKRLQDEVRSAFTSVNEITGQSTARIPYLMGVIDEGLRLYPPLVTSPPRFSPGAVVDGHYIPAGVTVSTNTWTPARDPRYWYEPEKFLPERWIGDGFGDNKQASRPFLLGSRVCIGMNLSCVEMRLTLAKLVFTYDMEFAPSSRDLDFVKDSNYSILWVKPEVRVIFTPRKLEARQ